MTESNKSLAIFGSKGMLGGDAITFFKEKGYNVYNFNRSDADVSDLFALSRILDNIDVDYILNCTGYTYVDGAESHREEAMKTNCETVRALSEVCKKREIFLIHISSDYVFPGEKKDGYLEDDIPGPAINTYGESKLIGENIIKETLPEESYLICRTQWLYGERRKNIIYFMVENIKNGEIKAVTNQHGVLTSTKEVCSQILWLLANKKYGIAHTVCCGGPMTWYDGALEIARLLNQECKIIPVVWKDLRRPAKRPTYGWLKNSRFPGMPATDWKISLKSYLKSQFHLQAEKVRA